MAFKWKTMAPRAIRVAVSSRQIVFFLRNVSVGLSGARVENLDHWRRVLSSDGIYSEEDSECIVAALLPCPRSFFKLVDSKHGELDVIFTPRPASIANHKRGAWLGWLGYCSLCCSPFPERIPGYLTELYFHPVGSTMASSGSASLAMILK